MDTIALVDEQVEDGRRLLERLRQEAVPVRAACWAKPLDEDRWSLYLATPIIDQKGRAPAYREVYRVLRSLENPWIRDSDINLIGENHPITRDVLEIQETYPGKLATRSRRPALGGLPIEDVYVYPRDAGPMTPAQVMETVFSLMNRPGVLRPSLVKLRDGSSLHAIPVGLKMGSQITPQIELQDMLANTRRTVSPDEVVSIQ